MTAKNHTTKTLLDLSTPFLEQLREIFTAIDQAYDLATDHYGFHCEGCEDNCCRTKFYHHTFLEYLYLYDGFKKLDPGWQADIVEKSKSVVKEMALAEGKGTSFRMMCPLNHDGRCLIYNRRPMICRMHGIPHELQKPGQDKAYGTGCGDFTKKCGKIKYTLFDRTPFYMQIAKLENELKEMVSISQRLKMTVADMIINMVTSKK